MDTNAQRRRFLHCAAAGAAAALSGSVAFAATEIAAAPPSRSAASAASRLRNAPRFFCTAYITPDAPGQSGQEATVARYPLALVPQDTRAAFVQWRDRVRQLNPGIVLLGYQIVIEETLDPGPGNDELRKLTANSSYCVYPGGYVPTVPVAPGPRQMRIFDPRAREWQEQFLRACRAVVSSYPYDGLFLDQCTVYTKAHPLPGVREEMRSALQATLLRLRAEYPDTIIVGNSSFHWAGLNGELNEARPADVANELRPFAAHAAPEVQLVQTLVKNPADRQTMLEQMQAAHARGAFFGAGVDYQHILPFELLSAVAATGSK